MDKLRVEPYSDPYPAVLRVIAGAYLWRVRPREGQELKWLRPNAMADYPMPPADEPLVALLRDLL